MSGGSDPEGVRRRFRLPPSHRRVVQDIDDELRFHLESRIAELVAAGVAPDAARRTAEHEYGDLAASRAELAAVDRRRLRRRRLVDLLDTFGRDLRYAARGLRRERGLTLTIILSLGLGVGANAAVFTVLDRVFFQAPAGVVEPGAIHRLYAHKVSAREPWYPGGKVTPLLGVRDLLELGDAARGTARIEGDYLDRGVRLQPSREPALMTTVSPGYFDLLGVRPARGRFFTPEEGRADGPPAPVAVISDAFWCSHYAADPAVLGRTVRVDETTYTIVGVAPPEFEGLELEAVDLWVPLSNYPGGMSGPPMLRLLARVEPGVDAQLLDDLLTARFRLTHADDSMVEDSSSIIVAPLLAARGPASALYRIPRLPERSLLLLPRLAGVAVLVLLIAVANVASLLLMRAIRRRREIAVRLALGVSRLRLVGQLVLESTLLALVGGTVALLVAELTGGALRAALSTELRWTDTVVDGRVVLLALGATVSAGLLAGLAPATVALRSDLAAALRTSSGTTRAGTTLRTGLLVAQAALCMALLACAGAFLQSLRNAATVDRGFDVERTVRVSLPGYYPDAAQQTAAAAARLRALPGVEAVGRTFDALGRKGFLTKVGPTYQDTIGVGPRGPSLDFVEPEFMRAVGLRLVAGRLLTAADDAAPVVVITESLAAALWPGQAPVGRCLHVREPHSPCRTVVGVVRDVRWDVTEPPLFQLYVPSAQAWTAPNPALIPHYLYVPSAQAWTAPNPALIPHYLYVRLRAAASAADVARLRAAVAPLVPSGADFAVRRVGDQLEPQLRPWRLAATLFLVFGGLGLAAAAAGIYGLVAYDVAQRSRELGIRIALGAPAPRLLALVVGSGLRVAALGLAAGAVAALVAGRVMAALLFDTSPYDARVLAETVLTLGVVSALASLVAAWRAVRVDPVIALSAE